MSRRWKSWTAILFLAVFLSSCERDSATKDSPAPGVDAASPRSADPSEELRAWLRSAGPQIDELITGGEDLVGDREADGRQLLTRADQARRASIALRQTPAPDAYWVDTQALLLAIDEVEDAAREASACIICGEPYSRYAQALHSLGSAFQRVFAHISPTPSGG